MNQAATQYIQQLQQWRVEVCEQLHKLVFKTVPVAAERLRNGKPHYLKMDTKHALSMPDLKRKTATIAE